MTGQTTRTNAHLFWQQVLALSHRYPTFAARIRPSCSGASISRSVERCDCFVGPVTVTSIRPAGSAGRTVSVRSGSGWIRSTATTVGSFATSSLGVPASIQEWIVL